MRAALVVLAILGFSFNNAFSQVEKGNVRIGGFFQLEAFKEVTNADFELDLGYSFSDNLEAGALLPVTKMEGVDKFGRYGGITIWHLKPDLKLVPGAGLALSRTFGYEDAAANGELIILDHFSTWMLFSLRLGH